MDAMHQHTAGHYGPRAQDYVASVVHAEGPDLRQLVELLQARRPGRVLDLGCGGGHVSYSAAPHAGEVVACDVTPEMLTVVSQTARERGLANISVQQGAAEQLPFEAGSFDAVLCRFSAHHWPDMEAGLREARRVLKADGFAIMIDVVAPATPVLDTHLQTVEVLRDPSHVRNYTLAEWTGALGRAGFSVESVTTRTLRMEFAVWTARTRTPPDLANAIRALQGTAPPRVHTHFAIGSDGSFDIQAATFVLAAA